MPRQLPLLYQPRRNHIQGRYDEGGGAMPASPIEDHDRMSPGGRWPRFRQTWQTGDGRDRTEARIVDTYPKGDVNAGKAAEQRAINARGSVQNLDNKRNEIAPKRWPQYGID